MSILDIQKCYSHSKPAAKHNKNAYIQIIDEGGALYRSDGEYWVPQTVGDASPNSKPLYVTESAQGLAFPPELDPGVVSLFRFMRSDQRDAVRARTFSVDLTTAIQSAMDSGESLYAPAGGYRIDGGLIVPATIPFTLRGEFGKTEFRAGANMPTMMQKASVGDGATTAAVCIEDIIFECYRKADRAIWIGASKKGRQSGLLINNFRVEGFRGGDDTGAFTARFYENDIRHVIIDGGAQYATAVETMPLYGINLPLGATDNALTDIVLSYMSEAGINCIAGGNNTYGVHSYGLDSADTGPKYTIVTGKGSQHHGVYADNPTVAGIKITGEDVYVGSLFAYWAADNVPGVGGAVPIEINDAVTTFGAGSISIRNGNAANPAVRYLGSSWGRAWGVGAVFGKHTPQPGSVYSEAASIIPGSIRAVGQNNMDCDVMADVQNTFVRAGYKWGVQGKLRHRISTNAGAETGSNAGSNLEMHSYADDGSTATRAWIYYRSSNQFTYDAKALFSSVLGIGGISAGGGVGVLCIANATTVPTTNPAGGGVLFAEGGALKWRGSSGTVTVIAPS